MADVVRIGPSELRPLAEPALAGTAGAAAAEAAAPLARALSATPENIDALPGLGAPEKKLAKSLLAQLPAREDMAAFMAELAAGTLTKKDSAGRTALDGLNRLATTDRHAALAAHRPPIAGRELLGDVVRHLADPLLVQQGPQKGTSGAATLEYEVLRRDPAEFVKIVEGLTSKAGSVKLRSGGGELRLPTESATRDTSGRSDVDRMLQSAILGSESALGVARFGELYQGITGQKRSGAAGPLAGGRPIAEKVLEAAEAGARVPVMTSFGAHSAAHWLSIEGVRRDEQGNPDVVTLRNPWGQDAGDDGNPPRVGLERGLIEMKWDDFGRILGGAVLPESSAPAAASAAPKPSVHAGAPGAMFASPLSVNRFDAAPSEVRLGVAYAKNDGLALGAHVGANARLSHDFKVAAEAGVAVGFRF